jgi:sulfoxide reductase heme-binding subunit YedZ
MTQRAELISKVVLFMVLAVPFVGLTVAAFTDGLGGNPVEKLTHETGEWALRLTLATLTVTPMRRLFGWNWPVRQRRMLGLYAFFYAMMHFTTYLWLDQFFDWAAIVEDLIKRPYIALGFAAVLLMLPLAMTSPHGMVRKLGGQRWRRLHRLVYPMAILGVLHYAWLVKADYREPFVYAAILAVLLLTRVRWRSQLPTAADSTTRETTRRTSDQT